MKILYVASAMPPFVNTGDSDNTTGVLPQALQALGADARVVLPLYGTIPAEYRAQMEFLLYTYVELPRRKQYCGLLRLQLSGVTYYFIDNESYFKRARPYGYHDDAERFAFFCLAVVRLLPMMDWTPDLVQCSGWQTALLPVYLEQEKAQIYGEIRTAFSFSDIRQQGRFLEDTIRDLPGLSPALRNGDLLRHDGQVNLMKGALYRADLITTVSPSYAAELRDAASAYGLQRAIEENSHKLRGILSGIDCNSFDPATDDLTYCAFSTEDLSGKKVNKSELQRNLGLDMDAGRPIVACIFPFAEEKGADLVVQAVNDIIDLGAQMVILGTGDPEIEQAFVDAQARYPGAFSVNIMTSNTLLRRIAAGADILLMPSRSEPCGQVQMIAMRYGTVPLVRQTGGLRDSVTPYPATNSNGFTFTYSTTEDMMSALRRTLALWHNDQAAWEALQRRCMETDFTWENAAREYLHIYAQLCGKL